ncbi:MAG: tRNA uridine-5-carboxymethylaminomethyl(34) synthesis enzyme MnmG [Candidatus Sericytochromatia bacterium]|nr:tRNA uridine-5-carboxymethylaminomethyl(34) synthesis enzyme MnmG [Candidatus Sericytochromatia bacterium]
MERVWDVVVVGGGHAGIEAGMAAHRLGAMVLLVTTDRATLGAMPCNPAIGGPAKSTLVREVDALGGWMARAADASRIQAKVLNASKGPAVQALRLQCDKHAYAAWMNRLVSAHLTVLEASARDFAPIPGGWSLETNVGAVKARSLVLTTGTFMSGLCHTGAASSPGGRIGEAPSTGLSEALRRLGLRTRRMKTGTPPRVDRRSLDFSQMQQAPGDAGDLALSFLPLDRSHVDVMCHLVYTNEKTHEIVRDNMHLSPMFQGRIEGPGPRYCPSFEDKVHRFADKPAHGLFIEPEGLETDWIYVQGFSTSLPADVQLAMLRTLPGFRQVELLRPGYAVEYDQLPAIQLAPTLEVKDWPGLFTAGQINGTSGYEEAAAQGLLAGLNAARHARGTPGVVLPRDGSFLGTLVDDLTTMDIPEPYRMLTARSEYRLVLRGDNADLRLTPLGRELGLVPDERWQAFEARREAIAEALRWLERTRILPSAEVDAVLAPHGEALAVPSTLADLLRRPRVPAETVWALGARTGDASDVVAQAAITTKYAGYIRRMEEDIRRQAASVAVAIPAGLDYGQVQGLSQEAREKLGRVRPTTLGQAQRIPGVTPVDIGLLRVHLARVSGGAPVVA